MKGEHADMLVDVLIPRFGETDDEEVVVTRWRKKPGEQVRKGEVLMDTELAKGTLEIESLYTGILVEILVPEGETTRPMSVAGRIRCE